MRFIKLLSLLALFALVLGGGQASALIVIDDFEEPVNGPPYSRVLEQFTVGVGYSTTNPGFEAGLPLANTIGGRRDFELTYITGGVNRVTSVANIIGSPDQLLQFSNGAGVEGQLVIAYGWGDFGAPPLNTDFSTEDTIQIYFGSTDKDTQFIVGLASGVVQEFRVYSLSNGYTGLYNIPLSDFPTIDLTDVDSVGFAFGFESTTGPDDQEPTYVANLQLTVDLIQTASTIPEPATLTLLGLGALALARRRRRS